MWGTARVYLKYPFVFELCEQFARSSQINFYMQMIHASWTNTKELDKIKKQFNRDFEKVGD